VNVRIPITERQRDFIESDTWGTVFRAGIGSGKTVVLCLRAALKAMQKRRQLIVSFSYPMLRDVVRVTMGEVLVKLGMMEGTDWTLNKMEMCYNLKGTEILMRSGDAPDSLRGLNVADFHIDEARQFVSRDIFDILIGRIRTEEDSSWSACTTPNGRDWVWRIGEKNDNVSVITQSTMENPFLPQAYIDHLLEMYTGVFAEQEIYGKVVEFIGEVIDPSGFRLCGPVAMSQGVRFWDLAFAQKKTSDWSVGAKCTSVNGEFIIADVVRVKAKYPDLKELIVNTALADGPGVKIGLEDVGAQRAVVDDVARDKRLSRFIIAARRPMGTKLARAMPWVSRIKLGGVKVSGGPWLDDFRAECAAFRADGTHPHDDQIDAVSGAWHVLMTTQTATSRRIKI